MKEIIVKYKIVLFVICVIAVIGIGTFGYFKFIKANNKNENSDNKKIDTNIENISEEDFSMTVDDVFYITGKGTVVTGKIEKGTINVNDTVRIVSEDKEEKSTVVTAIEMFRKTVDTASAGDNVGLLLKDIERNDIERGTVVMKP